MNRREWMTSTATATLALGTLAGAHRTQAAQPLTSAHDKHIKQMYLSTDNGDLYYWTAGSGPVVTCIHQSGNSAEEFAALVPHLVEHCQLLAIDLPGHGRSDDPIVEPTVDTYTQAIVDVLDHLDVEQSFLVGHHGGALCALNLASRFPERIKRCVLSGLGGPRSAAATRAFIAELEATDTTIRQSSDFVANAWDRYVDMMSDGAELSAIMKPYVAFLEARLRPFRGVMVNLKWDRRSALARMQTPALLLQGDRDPYVKNQADLLPILPNSQRQVLTGCGTFMFYDRPATCAGVLRDYFALAS